MKVTIEIDEHGYSKTVTLNDGSQLIEKWERTGHGFRQEENVFEDSQLLEETIEALGCDFELGAIADAMETESAEEFDYGDGDPITDDGHHLKRGEEFWTVACTPRDGKLTYVPLRLKYPRDWGSQGSTSFFSREKCKTECDERNGGRRGSCRMTANE